MCVSPSSSVKEPAVIISTCTVEPLYNGHHWDQIKDFFLYSEVSFAQGVTVDHAPLTIVANYRLEQDYGS